MDDESLVESPIWRVLPNQGIWAHPDEILITPCGQEGHYFVAQLLCKPSVSVRVYQSNRTDGSY